MLSEDDTTRNRNLNTKAACSRTGRNHYAKSHCQLFVDKWMLSRGEKKVHRDRRQQKSKINVCDISGLLVLYLNNHVLQFNLLCSICIMPLIPATVARFTEASKHLIRINVHIVIEKTCS